MTKKYYKVLTNDLCSCSSPIEKGEIDKRERVQYKIGEWIDAPKYDNLPSRLFVFDDLVKARRFALENYAGKIFECEVKNPINGFPCCSVRKLKDYWKWMLEDKFGEFEDLSTYIPSVLVTSVKLTIPVSLT